MIYDALSSHYLLLTTYYLLLTNRYSGHSIITHLLGPRFYCVDMGGWAFDAALLRGFKGVPWSYPGRRPRGTKSNATVWRGGESEFLQQLLGPHAYQHGQSVPLAVPQLGSCASSGRTWRL